MYDTVFDELVAAAAAARQDTGANAAMIDTAGAEDAAVDKDKTGVTEQTVGLLGGLKRAWRKEPGVEDVGDDDAAGGAKAAAVAAAAPAAPARATARHGIEGLAGADRSGGGHPCGWGLPLEVGGSIVKGVPQEGCRVFTTETKFLRAIARGRSGIYHLLVGWRVVYLGKDPASSPRSVVNGWGLSLSSRARAACSARAAACGARTASTTAHSSTQRAPRLRPSALATARRRVVVAVTSRGAQG
jgi:hypothetical protein